MDSGKESHKLRIVRPQGMDLPNVLDLHGVGSGPVRRATREALVMAAADRYQDGRVYFVERDFYTALAERLEEGQVVEEAIDDKSANELLDDIFDRYETAESKRKRKVQK